MINTDDRSITHTSLDDASVTSTPAHDRADVRQLATWLTSEVSRGATRIELRDTRANAPIAAWVPTNDADELARVMVDFAARELERAVKSTMIATCANEPVRVVDVPRRERTVVAISFAPSGPATLRLAISDDEIEPEPVPPAEVLRQALRGLAMLANLRTSPTTSMRWLLLERLVGFLSASDARVELIAEQLDPAELKSLAEILGGAR